MLTGHTGINLSHARSSAWLFVAAILFCAGVAGAQDTPPWPVKGKLLGEEGEKAEDISGIACASATGFPRKCLLVDDESQGAQIVILKDGEIVAGQFIQLIDDRFKKGDKDEALELDAEGVAYADGYFYVIGSHGHPRDKNKKLDPAKDAPQIAANIKANSRVFRLRIDPATISDDGKLSATPEIKSSADLPKFFAAQPDLKPFIGQRLDKNGLTVEGIAVRDGRLYAGLRGPSLQDEAAILSVPLSALFEGATADGTLTRLELGTGRGVRDLIAVESNFLVLAGPTAETDGVYSIFLWDGKQTKKWLLDLPKFTGKKNQQIKPEAILPLDRDTKEMRLLVLFDGPKEGAPRVLAVPYP